jgi:hypothetical protein
LTKNIIETRATRVLTKNIIETRATRVLPGRLKEVLGKASAAASSWNDVATDIW